MNPQRTNLFRSSTTRQTLTIHPSPMQRFFLLVMMVVTQSDVSSPVHAFTTAARTTRTTTLKQQQRRRRQPRHLFPRSNYDSNNGNGSSSRSSSNSRTRTVLQSSAVTYDDFDFAAEEVQEMKQLIHDLSTVLNDEDRRRRLRRVIDDAVLIGDATAPTTTNTNTNNDHDNANDNTPKTMVMQNDDDPCMSSSSSSSLSSQSKRFTVLFNNVLTQAGEHIQREAREKFSASSRDNGDIINNNSNSNSNNLNQNSSSSSPSGDDDEEQKEERTKSVEELQLWALIDMMIQSKTTFKNYNL